MRSWARHGAHMREVIWNPEGAAATPKQQNPKQQLPE